MITDIAHLAFNVTDMEKSIDFYCNKLGFTDAFELRDKNGNPWIRYIKVAKGQFIELFYTDGIAMKGQSYSHLCLQVDDILKIADRMERMGITLDVPVKQGSDKNYQCWVCDPDGNRIEFMMIGEDSPQSKA